MSSPIPLPHVSAESQKAVKLPAAPSQPPTVRDITHSAHYAIDILTAHARKKATDEDVAEAELYRNKLLSTRAVEPVWFAEAMSRALAPLAADIRTLKDDVRDLKDDVRDLKDDVRDLKDDVHILKVDVRDTKGELADVKRIVMRTSDMSAGTAESVLQ